MKSRRVYLDHNATTPVRGEVLEAMLPYLRESYGNPNSVHQLGQEARKAVEAARAQAARLINAASVDEVVFTSCGSEADVLAISGAAEHVFRASGGQRRHIVSSAVEHDAVREVLRVLQGRGFEVTRVGVDSSGRVSPEAVRSALKPATALVSIMHANNEVGTVQPIAEIAEICRERGVLLHTDAVQSVGKIPVDVRALGVDLLALSGHKINAPKGVGALYIRSGRTLVPVITGHQEKNRRGGTENVASIVALGAACELARTELKAHARELVRLRDRLEAGVLRIPGSRLTSCAVERLPQTSHFCFEGLDGHHLVVSLDLEGICVSSGPACAEGMSGVSHVLAAMGVGELGRGSLRVSLGLGSRDADVDRLLEVLPRTVERLRQASLSQSSS